MENFTFKIESEPQRSKNISDFPRCACGRFYFAIGVGQAGYRIKENHKKCKNLRSVFFGGYFLLASPL